MLSSHAFVGMIVKKQSAVSSSQSLQACAFQAPGWASHVRYMAMPAGCISTKDGGAWHAKPLRSSLAWQGPQFHQTERYCALATVPNQTMWPSCKGRNCAYSQFFPLAPKVADDQKVQVSFINHLHQRLAGRVAFTLFTAHPIRPQAQLVVRSHVCKHRHKGHTLQCDLVVRTKSHLQALEGVVEVGNKRCLLKSS